MRTLYIPAFLIALTFLSISAIAAPLSTHQAAYQTATERMVSLGKLYHHIFYCNLAGTNFALGLGEQVKGLAMKALADPELSQTDLQPLLDIFYTNADVKAKVQHCELVNDNFDETKTLLEVEVAKEKKESEKW